MNLNVKMKSTATEEKNGTRAAVLIGGKELDVRCYRTCAKTFFERLELAILKTLGFTIKSVDSQGGIIYLNKASLNNALVSQAKERHKDLSAETVKDLVDSVMKTLSYEIPDKDNNKGHDAEKALLLSETVQKMFSRLKTETQVENLETLTDAIIEFCYSPCGFGLDDKIFRRTKFNLLDDLSNSIAFSSKLLAFLSQEKKNFTKFAKNQCELFTEILATTLDVTTEDLDANFSASVLRGNKRDKDRSLILIDRDLIGLRLKALSIGPHRK